MPTPHAAAIELSPDERARLESWARERTPAGALALRSGIVLAAADGKSNSEIAEQFGTSRPTVVKWRNRFRESRLEGLLDEPRPGRPRTVSDDQVERIVTTTLNCRPTDAAQWSTRSLAVHLGVSQNAVWRTWQAFGLQPHRRRSLILPNDPPLAEMAYDICGLYLNPPERVVALCVDAQSQILEQEEARPLLPATSKRATEDNERSGISTLYDTLDLMTGSVIGRPHSRHRAIALQSFLQAIDREVPRNLDVQLVLDNGFTRTTPKINRWLATHPRFHLHFTPTSGSWLDLVDHWFADLADKQPHRAAQRAGRELDADIRAWSETWAEGAQPYVWTQPAARITDSIDRHCKRINQTNRSDPGTSTNVGPSDAIRRRLSPEDRRNEILAAAREVFRETGVHGTTMADIAERAGITVTHLYGYFRKDELYRQAVQSPLEELGRRVAQDSRALLERPDVTRVQLLGHFHEMCLDYFSKMVPFLRAGDLPFGDGGRIYQEALFGPWRDLVDMVLPGIAGWDEKSLNLELIERSLMGLYLTIAIEGEVAGEPVNAPLTAAKLAAMFAPTRITERDRTALRRAAVRVPAEVGTPWPKPEPHASPRNGGPPRRMKKAERQASILVAARRVFNESGYTGARSREIAERAGITETFLYRTLSSKEEIYEAAIEAPVEAGLREFSRAAQSLAQGRKGVPFMLEFLALALSFFLEHGRIMATAMGADLDRAQRFFGDRAQDHLTAIGEVIVEQVGFDKQDVTPRLAWTAILGSVWGVTQSPTLRDASLTIEEVALQMTRWFMTGVVPTQVQRRGR